MTRPADDWPDAEVLAARQSSGHRFGPDAEVPGRRVEGPEPAEPDRPDLVVEPDPIDPACRAWWAERTRTDWATWALALLELRATIVGRTPTRHELSRLGGLARALALSPERRSEIARAGFRRLAGRYGSRRKALCRLANRGRIVAAGRTTEPPDLSPAEITALYAECGLAGQEPAPSSR